MTAARTTTAMSIAARDPDPRAAHPIISRRLRTEANLDGAGVRTQSCICVVEELPPGETLTVLVGVASDDLEGVELGV